MTTDTDTDVVEELRALRASLGELNEKVDAELSRRSGATVLAYVISGISLVAAVAAIGFGVRAVDESKKNVAASVETAVPATVAPAKSPITATLSNFAIQSATTIAAGQVTLNITNVANEQHELLVFRTDLPLSAFPLENGDVNEEGAGLTKVSDGDNLDPGATQHRTVDLSTPGRYVFVCNLPGHFGNGMAEVVTVQ